MIKKLFLLRTRLTSEVMCYRQHFHKLEIIMRYTYFALLFFANIFTFSDNIVALDSEHSLPSKKLLVLIISTDRYPIYVELQKIWRSYSTLDSENVEVYFLEADPNLPTITKIDGDIIWTQTDDGWIGQSAGIINKTILSMETMLPRLDEFDYVLRTNLSSFYVFPRLLKVLETLPKTGCYFGMNTGGCSQIGSGAGIIMSPDVIRLLVENKQQMLGKKTPEDDSMIYQCLSRYGIQLILHDRIDFLSMDDWINKKDQISDNIFQFRVKCHDQLRLSDDIYIHHQLLKMFYPNSLYSLSIKPSTP